MNKCKNDQMRRFETGNDPSAFGKEASPLVGIKSIQAGQSLVSLILICVIGLTIVTGSLVLIFLNSQSGVSLQEGTLTYEIAQSGADNALLKLLRDPAYTGETMTINGGNATIQVSSASGTLTATSSGTLGSYIRKIQIKAHYDSNYILVIDSRKEIF